MEVPGAILAVEVVALAVEEASAVLAVEVSVEVAPEVAGRIS